MAEDIALLKKASGFLNFATGTGELIDLEKLLMSCGRHPKKKWILKRSTTFGTIL